MSLSRPDGTIRTKGLVSRAYRDFTKEVVTFVSVSRQGPRRIPSLYTFKWTTTVSGIFRTRGGFLCGGPRWDPGQGHLWRLS